METALVPEFTLHDRLVKARKIAGHSPDSLAEVLGVSESTVKRIERAPEKYPARDLMAWALATGVSASWLLTGHADTDPSIREYRDQLVFDLYAAA